MSAANKIEKPLETEEKEECGDDAQKTMRLLGINHDLIMYIGFLFCCICVNSDFD